MPPDPPDNVGTMKENEVFIKPVIAGVTYPIAAPTDPPMIAPPNMPSIV